MGYYEILVTYGRDCDDVICFKYNGFLNDSNDIVTQAIELGFLGEEDRRKVKSAKSIPKYEYQQYISEK